MVDACAAAVETEQNDVLQFLLGVAPLPRPLESTPTSCDEKKEQHAMCITSESAAATVETRSVGDAVGVNYDPALDEEEDAIPVLEYVLDAYESDDDYIEFEAANVQEMGNEVDHDAVEGVHGIRESKRPICEVGDLLKVETFMESPDLEAVSEKDDDIGFISELFRIAEAHTGAGLSDTASNCTDHDRGSSDDDDSRGILEIEQELPAQSECVDLADKVGDGRAHTAAQLSIRPAASRVHDSVRSDPERTRGETTELSLRCDRSSVVLRESKGKHARTKTPALCASKRRSDRDGSESCTSTATSGTDECQEEQGTEERLHPPRSSRTHNSRKNAAQVPEVPVVPSSAELAFVGCVAIGLACYLLASIYAYFHPIFVPLPLLSTLQTPFDMSNVTLDIASPRNHSLLQQHAAYVEWTLSNYPVEVIETYGPEVFQYRVYVNEKQILFEIGLLNMSTPSAAETSRCDSNNNRNGGAICSHEAQPPRATTLDTTIRHRIAAKHVPDFATYALRVEVQFPIPGSEGGIQTLSQRVLVTKALEVYRKLELFSPKNGSTFLWSESVALEYKATNVERMEIVIDGSSSVWVNHIEDGRFLLRGLGAGIHTIKLNGYEANGQEVASEGVYLVTITS